MKDFLMIDNNIFGQAGIPQSSKFHLFGTVGFAILSYLLWDGGTKKCCNITLSEIMNFLNIKDKRTAVKYLSILHSNNIIICHCDLNTIDRRNYFLIDLLPYFSNLNKFEKIPTSIFQQHYCHIADIGWSIYVLLSKLYNPQFECANPSEDYISILLNINRKSVGKYLIILQDRYLINIIPKDNIYIGLDENDQDMFTYTNNKYKISNYI